jgi:hypothetical protein
MLRRKQLLGQVVLTVLATVVLACGPRTVRSYQNDGVPNGVDISTPVPGKKKMSEELGYPTVDQAKANQQLESFVFDIRHGRKVEPRNLDPKHVEEFIRKNIDRSRDPLSFGRIRTVIDFYDLASVKDHFEKLLTRSEKDEREVLQSLESVRIIAEQGDESDEKKAFGYYDYLVRLPASENAYEQFTEAVDSFGPIYSLATLSDVMKKRYAVLKEQGKDDEYVDGVAEQLFTLINGRLPNMTDQIKARANVAGIASTSDRIKKLAMIYLGLDDLASPEFERWSARQLRRLSREGSTGSIIANWRADVSEITASGCDREDEESRQIRDARAVRFFGGKLTDDEKGLVDEASEYQVDYLDRDFY